MWDLSVIYVIYSWWQDVGSFLNLWFTGSGKMWDPSSICDLQLVARCGIFPQSVIYCGCKMWDLSSISLIYNGGNMWDLSSISVIYNGGIMWDLFWIKMIYNDGPQARCENLTKLNWIGYWIELNWTKLNYIVCWIDKLVFNIRGHS